MGQGTRGRSPKGHCKGSGFHTEMASHDERAVNRDGSSWGIFQEDPCSCPEDLDCWQQGGSQGLLGWEGNSHER